MKNITVSDIKKNNLSLIYNLIYRDGKISKQEIASQLKLSLPNVTEKLVKLEEQGLIRKGGHFESSVGRRAVAYVIQKEARFAIGVGIYSNKVKILSVDLMGNICGSTRYDMDFMDNPSYYKEVAYLIKDYILEKNYLTDQILGIGFAISGLTSVDRRKITYGKTLGNTGLEIEAFSQYLNFPCSFFHDAKSAANAELWIDGNLTDALYLSLGEYLGGAMIKDGEILLGENGHCGAAEHMQMDPNGRPCYCGQKGCMETLCSISALLKPGEKISLFFEAVREGEREIVSRWDAYLQNLSRALSNLHILLDRDIILGGKLSQYLTEEDLNKLVELIQGNSVFSDKGVFFRLSSYSGDSVTVGSALSYIQDFINQI